MVTECAGSTLAALMAAFFRHATRSTPPACQRTSAGECACEGEGIRYLKVFWSYNRSKGRQGGFSIVHARTHRDWGCVLQKFPCLLDKGSTWKNPMKT
jgi:hypothetical protein